MKKTLLTVSFVLAFVTSYAQAIPNLDFEISDTDTSKDWDVFGTGAYKVAFDQNIQQQGKVSASIESLDDKGEFKALSYTIPVAFGGKNIKLTGYIKTDTITNGWAGLWMRIDPQVGFDNMESRGIIGTTGWTKYEIELTLNSSAKSVSVGGLLAGNGKMWLDNLEITIDGLPLENAPAKTLAPAEKDNEFDSGSQINLSNLDPYLIDNLQILGKVWGFLKYYHPAIGKGNYNWDYELFRMLPKYLKLTTPAERDALLVTWINSLGTIVQCLTCNKTSEDALLKPDLKWITDSGLSNKLQSNLNHIQANRHQGDHYYIASVLGVGNPEFKNENPYSNMNYPDAGFRLLALYKYWNIIQYFNPNKHLIDKDWSAVLTEYIPKFAAAKNKLEYELAAIKIIADIKDTHANLWGGNDKIQEIRGQYFPPVHVRFAENKLVIDDYFNPEMKTLTGLEIGDVITHVNGTSVQDFVIANHDVYPASNQPTRLRDMSRDILRSNLETIDITYSRNNQSSTTTLKLYNQKDINYYGWYKPEMEGQSYRMLDDNIGYVTLKNIKDDDVDVIKKEFKDTKGIIIDIRNYPSAFMPFSLGPYFISKNSPFVKFTTGNINNPGEFSFRENIVIPSNGNQYKGRVMVLVNELTQSSAEYTAMAFRAGDDVTIVGSTTAGADGNVSQIVLPGNLRTMISGIGVYYPDGKETQRIGIVPDVVVELSVQGIKQGTDEPLEKAIALINSAENLKQ